MRRFSLLIVVFVLLTFSTSVFAAGYGAAGCGPGSMFFKENTKSEQLMSWLVNFAIGALLIPSIQQSAISSGVSNCGASGRAKAEGDTEIFVAQNFYSLAKQMASGGGENLQALASLLGCPVDQTERFAAFSKQNYPSIFKDSDTTPGEVLSALKVELSHDPAFATVCQKI